jgi:hypothetical protein
VSPNGLGSVVVARRTGSWQPVRVDSDVERGPTAIPVVPHRGSLELLPLEVLSWPDFESLQWRILRDVEGLRHAQIYGNPGQSQRGLDIVAIAADDSGVALQSKRVEQFGPAKITSAVDAFRNTTRPFDVSRFIVGVSREVRGTQALDRFKALQKELKPVELELWDKRELSMKLKGAPQIVIEYFGNDIAELFCGPFVIGTTVVPSHDVVAVRQAIARTPEVTTGAGDKIAQAKALTDLDPGGALTLVEEAQTALTDAGFAGHAAQHEALRSSLLVTAGRGPEATRRRLDQLWVALDQGQTTLANIASSDIRGLAAQVNRKASRDHLAVAEAAVHLYDNPLASVPGLSALLVGDASDRARLAALAGETALAAGNQEWLAKSATRIRKLAEKLPEHSDQEVLRVRLRVLAAEGSGTWAPVLAAARSLKLGYDLAALVQARHARHLAHQQRFSEADAAWDEAAGTACLAGRWTDASRWIFSRRAFRTRWNPFTSDQLLPVQTALLARGPDATVLTRDEDALEYAYGRLAEGKLRPAAIAAQRALRDAVTLSDWEGERRARRLLADVLAASGEPQMAVDHLVLAGEVSAVKRLGADQSTRFLDVTPHLTAKPWWVAGAAYRLIAAQADLVPDDVVPYVAESVLTDFAAAGDGRLVDLVAFAGSRYLGAIAAVAGVADRLDEHHADHVLHYFESQPPVAPNQYRYHDEDEAKAVAGILTAHPSLAERALTHLIALLGRSEVSRNAKSHDAVIARLDQARPLLTALAEDGNVWAREVLATENPERVAATEIQDARARLEAHLEHTPGVFSVGSASGSVHDATLVRTLPVRRQQTALEELIERGADPYVAASDRGKYLLAASNLLPPTNRVTRTELLGRVLGLVLSPPESAADAVEAQFGHPLGAVRMGRTRDSRAEAAFLAAALARTRLEKERVRTAALGLVGDDTVSEVWTTRAFQRLGDTMAPDIGFLSGQNWALKSLAAILWSKTTEPAPVGYRLASDADVRVRRALAVHLAESQADEDAGILAEVTGGASGAAHRREARASLLRVLQDDPCFSVRAAATTSD